MKWAEDKTKHAVISFALVLILYELTANPTIAMMWTMAIGIAKEIYDEFKYRGFDLEDLIADAIGIILGGLICLLI